MSFTEHHTTSFDGLSLYHREYGDPENPSIVLCLTGLTRNSADFDALAVHLSGRYRVICPDLRGRGQSQYDPNWKQYVPPTYVRDMWKLLDDLDIGSVAVIGTSLGGLMGMIMADQQAHRLHGLVLNDIGPEITEEAKTRILAYAGKTPTQDDWAGATAMTRNNYELAYPNEDDDFWAAQVKANWHETDDGRIKPAYDPAIGDAIRESVKAVKVITWLQRFGLRRLKGLNLNPWDNFRKVSMPCLLLRGALSDLLSTDIVQRMQAMKPDLKTLTVADRGHVPTLNEPEVRAALDDFLDSLPQ